MTTTETPRVRRSLRRTFIVIFIILVPVAAHAVWDQIEANRLAAEIKALRDRGEAVDTSAENQPLASGAEKEASRLYAAAAMLSADSLPPYGPLGDRPAPNTRRGLAADIEAIVRARRSLNANVAAGNGMPDPPAAQLSAVVHLAEPQLALMDRAAELPFTRFSPERSLYSYFTSDVSTLAAVGSLRADLLALQGNGGAADALRPVVKLARTERRGNSFPVLPSTSGSLQLVLERTHPDSGALERLQRAYEEASPENTLAASIAHRRAEMLESLWDTRSIPHFSKRLGSRGIGRWESWSSGSFAYAVVRPYVTHQFRQFLSDMNEAVELARRPLPEAFQAATAQRPEVPLGGPMPMPSKWVMWLQMKTGVPIWHDPRGLVASGAVERVARTVAGNRVAVVAIAVERYRLAHGTLPSSLDALRPEFLNELPVDPFTAGPLHYRVSPDGYRIYSAGPDRQDDGGDIGPWRSDLVPPYPAPKNKDIGVSGQPPAASTN